MLSVNYIYQQRTFDLSNPVLPYWWLFKTIVGNMSFPFLQPSTKFRMNSVGTNAAAFCMFRLAQQAVQDGWFNIQTPTFSTSSVNWRSLAFVAIFTIAFRTVHKVEVMWVHQMDKVGLKVILLLINLSL